MKNIKTMLYAFLTCLLCGCSTDVNSSISENENVSSNSVEEESSSSEVKEESSSSEVDASSSTSSSPDDEYDVDESFDFSTFGVGKPSVEEKTKLEAYTPTTFLTSSYSTSKKTIVDGVDLIVATYKLNNGSEVSPNCVVVDLNKASIAAGTTKNETNLGNLTKGTPYAHALAYEQANPGKKVLAATNADFFGSAPVNAFVKDGIIVKDSHNDTTTDVPVSSPMLFGVSSQGARIGPMSNLTNYGENVKAKLTTKAILIGGSDKSNKGTHPYYLDASPTTTSISVVATLNKSCNLAEGTRVYKFKKIQADECKENEIRGCIVERVNTNRVKVTDDRYGYLILGAKFKAATIAVGDYFATSEGIFSTGGMWNYYDTILGARHSLVENGNIPSTVALEEQNGAKARVPRTAVGITSDGKVVIVSVEDVHYHGYSTVCTGLTLVQLADFMRYFGCYDAANFDGGGSSQLITRDSLNSNFIVRTKSSDTNSTTLTSTRLVINSILVTTK